MQYTLKSHGKDVDLFSFALNPTVTPFLLVDGDSEVKHKSAKYMPICKTNHF